MNALDSVHLTQEATLRANRWAQEMPNLVLALVETKPTHLRRYDAVVWVTAVILFQGEGHDPMAAATRLAQYLALYMERHDTTPTLEAVMKHAADRRLKEPR